MLLPEGITPKQREHARNLIIHGHAERKVKRARDLESLKREFASIPDKLEKETARLMCEQGRDDAALQNSLKKVEEAC